MVRIMVLVPSEREEITGRQEAKKLNKKASVIRTATTLSFLAGGMMIARNIPNKETLRALTIRAGSIFPAVTPSGSDCPARDGNGHGTIGIPWMKISRPCDGDAKELICNVKSHEQTMSEGKSWCETLSHGAAHEQITGIGDQGHDRHFHIRRIGGDHSDTCIFTGRCIIQHTH